MQKPFILIVAVLLLCPAVQLNAQSPLSKYSWRLDKSEETANEEAGNKEVADEAANAGSQLAAATKINKADKAPVTPGRSFNLRTAFQRPTKGQNAPVPPKMKRRPFLVSFRNQDKQQAVQPVVDTQPSLSDAQDYTFQPPSPPQAESVMSESVPVSPEPALSVQSNPQEEVNYCNRDCRRGCNLGCERQLFPTNCRGIRTGGWLSVGYHNRDNILVNNRQDQVALHQAWLFREKAASRSGDWDIGYRLDLVYGIDAQDLQAFGNAPTGAPTAWDNSWDFGSYGWALPQAYVQFANCEWDVKVGKFFSPFGYEVIGAPSNFFYSHSYTMYNTEPFTMSGVLTERQIAPGRSIILGATLGWDTGFENNDGGNLITGIRLQPNDFVDIALTSSIGDTGYRGTGTMSSAVAQLQLTDSLSYVFQGDMLNLEEVNEFGFIHYLFNEINPCLKLGARLEWWKSDQFTVPNRSTYEFTMGANYRANANITLRPEVRFDWGALAIDPGQPIVGVDAVITF